MCVCWRFPWVVECRPSQAKSSQLLRLCWDLLSAGSAREPPGDGGAAARTAARAAEGQRPAHSVDSATGWQSCGRNVRSSWAPELKTIVKHPSIFSSCFLLHSGLQWPAGASPSCSKAQAGWTSSQFLAGLHTHKQFSFLLSSHACYWTVGRTHTDTGRKFISNHCIVSFSVLVFKLSKKC